MKLTRTLEPGVLAAFRLFTAVRLILLLVNAAVELVVSGWPSTLPLLFLFNCFDVLILLAFLSSRFLAQCLKSWYLPVGIAWATLLPILEMHIAFKVSAAGFVESTALVGAWQLVLVLLIPLFIIGWQYTFRSVVAFSLASAVIDLIPFYFHTFAHLPNGGYYPLFGVIFIRMVFMLFIGYMLSRLMATQRGLRAELTAANNRLAQYAGTLEHLTISRERNRVARELHDVLAHTLSGLAVELEAVRSLWGPDTAQAQAMLDHSLRATRDGLTETRRALQALRASPLEDLGLGLAVRGLAESAANRSNFKLALQVSEDLPEYPPEIEQCFYRVAQEALANIVEHSDARAVQFCLLREGGLLRLTVGDDGGGFDPTAVNSRQQFGLEGMRDRAEAIGARFTLTSPAAGGTLVTLEYGGVP